MTATPAFDPSLLDLFRAELETHLPALSEGLLALEKDPRQPKRLEALMRAAHSVKGAARIVGVDAAVTVAHAMEDCFVAAQKGEVTLASGAVDVLLRGVDALQRVAPGDEGGDMPDADSLRRLVAAIGEVRAGKPSSPSAPAAHTALVEAGPPTLRPAGDLDGDVAEALRGRLGELLRTGAAEIRLDFSDVGAIGPGGLALLAVAARDAALAKPPAALRAVNATPEVRALLRLTRLDGAYPGVAEGA